MSKRDRTEIQIRAGARRNGKTFELVLREAYNAGYMLGREAAPHNPITEERRQAAFEEWRKEQLP